jgi:peroxiredoxin
MMKQLRGPARRRVVETCRVAAGFCLLAACLFHAQTLGAQQKQIVWSEQEKPIAGQLRGLRQLPDETRAKVTKDLALAIRRLPASPNRLVLANGLANLSTEGDFGLDTLQEVATTLAAALREQPPADDHGQPAMPYVELAQLVRYEHVQASSDSPQFAAAMSKLAADDQRREHADFTLSDLAGKTWSLQGLHGKVVLVNFWATWCPPCRKEMPDLETLYQQFKDQGFLVLAISDEDKSKVQAFLAERHTTYPILLDPGRKVNELFQVEGIPKTFVYNRDGKLAAEAIDMRTRKQFLELLAQAGLQVGSGAQ